MLLAKPGDLTLLGARTLEGFNATIDPRKKRLVAEGPPPRRRIEIAALELEEVEHYLEGGISSLNYSLLSPFTRWCQAPPPLAPRAGFGDGPSRHRLFS